MKVLGEKFQMNTNTAGFVENFSFGHQFCYVGSERVRSGKEFEIFIP